jgi:peptide/nickel transport system substrate-binding protein
MHHQQLLTGGVMHTFLSRLGKPLRFAILGLAVAAPAMAQDFTLALSSPPTTMDPQFYNLTPNLTVSDHIFETLVTMSPDMKVVPALAESWSMVDNLTWEFKLRKGVKFHDGSEMTADDVLWSLDRPATITGSPASFTLYTKAIVKKTVVDPYTIRLTTKEPYPLMLPDMTMVYIVSKKATKGLTNEDFASGKGVVGTGPFKFVKFLRDDRVELVRNDDYWGKKPAWSKVTLRFIANPATRIASLLSGDVQAIENVPTPDLGRVRSNNGLSLFSKVSNRLIYLYPDTVRDKSPFVTDKEGKPLDKNPLKDVRVRQAMSMAINREAIKDRVMEGLAAPTDNLVPINLFGYNPQLKEVKYDPEGAKKLLAEAGYPNGFGLTLHTPNNRYINDERISQTVAQMFSRIGITTKVDASPMSVYASRGAKGEYSFGLLGWQAQTGEASSPLRAILACPDPAKGFGSANWSKYCNPKADQVLVKALNTVSDVERLKLLQEAAALDVNDGGVIPLHHQVTTWAAKKGIVFTPRTDERTHALGFAPQ